jgi:hypothetical protein
MPEKPSDLVNHNCLIYTDSGAGDHWPIFSTDSEMSVHGNLSSNSVFALRDAAEMGQGIVVLPQYAAAGSLKAGRLIQILQQYTTTKRPIAVVYPHRGLVPTKTTVFVDMLKTHIPKALAAVSCPRPQMPDASHPVSQDGEVKPAASPLLVDGSADGASGDSVDRGPPANGRSAPPSRRTRADAPRG